jgi:hypothetical protein
MVPWYKRYRIIIGMSSAIPFLMGTGFWLASGDLKFLAAAFVMGFVMILGGLINWRRERSKLLRRGYRW